MTLVAKQGVCHSCGHDHGTFSDPLVPPIFNHCSELEARIKELEEDKKILGNMLLDSDRRFLASQQQIEELRVENIALRTNARRVFEREELESDRKIAEFIFGKPSS